MPILSVFVFYEWLLLAITITVLLYLRVTRHRNYWKSQNVVHEKFSLFFGPQMKQLYKPLHVVDQELYRKHGRLFGSFEDGKPVLYVAEPDLLKLILVKDSGLTQRKVVEVDDPVMRNVMLNVPPDQWKKLRTATSPAFTSGKLRKMQVIIDSCAQLTSERLKKAATASEDVDLKGFYGHFSLDAVASCSFGVKLSQNSPEEGSFIRSAKNVFFAEVTPYVVLCALFQKLGHTFRKRIFNRKSFEFYKNATIDIIKKREENNIRHEDFLQMMMNAKEVAKQTSASEEKTVFGSDFEGSVPKLQDVKNLTEEEALAQCVLFFLAGQDTASTTASFASYLLAINPHTQEKLQAEVDDCFRKHGSSPSYDVVSKLPYLESVVNETLRVMTPGSRVDRVFHEDYMLGETGIKISKDCVVLIPIYSLHHDPEFFPEPDVFNPDRRSSMALGLDSTVRWLRPLAVVLTVSALVTAQESRFVTVPCAKLFTSMAPMLKPCSCYFVGPPDNGTGINCDRVAFQGNFPMLPYRQRIHRFSQRHAGVQDLEAQLFTASGVPLRVLDLSHNRVRRLSERLLEGVHGSLQELHLGSNLLGDQLSPVFATNEFRALRELRLLDLSDNRIQGVDSAVFKGLDKLEVLNINDNDFEEVPASSLVDLPALTWLSLDGNRIPELTKDSFPPLEALQTLNLTKNVISSIEEGTFVSVPRVQVLYLGSNRIKNLPSGAFDGLQRLTTLDLSNNFMVHIPTTTLRRLPALKMLTMRSNKIRSFNGAAPSELKGLEYLDLSRNEISQVEPGSFDGMKSLRALRLGVNQIRKVDAATFRGLVSLEAIYLEDNQLLVFPSALLGSLPRLQKLHLDYNRIAVLSPGVLSAGVSIRELSLAYNLITEIPNGTFKDLQFLETLNLRGNKLSAISSGSLDGLQNSMIALDLGDNGIVSESLKLEFPNLQLLSLGKNKLTTIPANAFSSLKKLKRLDLSNNQIRFLPAGPFAALRELQFLDLAYNSLTDVKIGALNKLVDLQELTLKSNFIKDMNTMAFLNLTRLKTLDLSYNRLSAVRTGTFDQLPSLRKLKLNNNVLNSFKAELFAKETHIEDLNLSQNQIAYLYPDSFTMHPRLRKLDISHNKLSFFPSEIIRSIWSLEVLKLGYNKLHTLEDSDFADLPRLRHLDLQHNQISSVGERAFQNSTQLRYLELQHNQIPQLGERLFQGISQLNLDLSYNHMSSLSPDVFSRLRDFKLESINLAHNEFSTFPTVALRKQYSFLEKANFSNNHIEDFPSNADVLVNIKELDVSNNPLTTNAHHVLLAEPKSVRSLHLANTGIRSLPLIESPFLRLLNLSGNRISSLSPNNFQKTTLLEVLDLSGNEIPNLSIATSGAWANLKKLKKLDLSDNPISYLVNGDLQDLKNLDEFDFSRLTKLNHIECEALQPLSRLTKLNLYGYGNLQALQTRKCLEPFEGLESLGIEIKDNLFKDQLQKVYSPRLSHLYVTGKAINGLSSSAFAGIRGRELRVTISNTSLSDLPTTIFLPLPLSTKRIVNVNYNQINRINPQLLTALSSKQATLQIEGIQENPITCDCNLIPLWRWIQDHKSTREDDDEQGNNAALIDLACVEPHHLNKILIVNLQMDDLFCDDEANDEENEETSATSNRLHKATTAGGVPTTRTSTTPSNNIVRKTSPPHRKEPEIVFEAPTTARPRQANGQSVLTKVDTMIIGIVAGVVAFVCILIMVICIVRLRRSRPHGHYASTTGPVVNGHAAKCTCLKPPPSTCTCFPPYAVPLAYHPGSKMMGPPSMYNTMSRSTAYFGPYESDVDHR